MTDKYHSDTQAKVETLTYIPTAPDTNDLEPATKTITATSKQATADYSKSLTLPKPSDARLVIKRVAARLQITRDSGTSTNLYCTVSVDSADGSTNILFNGIDVQANSLSAVDLTSGTVFNLLSDGLVHTFYFFFWVNSGDSVISLVKLREGVGTCSTNYQICLSLSYSGEAFLYIWVAHEGSGTVGARIIFSTDPQIYFLETSCGGTFVLANNPAFAIKGTVATDLNFLNKWGAILRSTQ